MYRRKYLTWFEHQQLKFGARVESAE